MAEEPSREFGQAAAPEGQPEIPADANEGCVGPTAENAGKASACAGCPSQKACSSGQFRKPDPALGEVADRMSEVKHKILVLSGKGGVGKSTVASQLAWALAGKGFQVGLLDIDICGPSAPHMMGVEDEEIRKSSFGWSPVYAADNLGVMSVGFMLNSKTDAIIWRGPRKNGLIKEFLTGVDWGQLDFLIVDAPPGTSDEHISLAQYLKNAAPDGAVIVTTPQEVALLDVRKEISFCRKTNIPVLGVVENMAGFVCPCCKTKSEIFVASSGGARQMAEEMKVPFLGSLPLDPNLIKSCEEGKSFLATYPESAGVDPFNAMLSNLLQATPSLKETAEAGPMEADEEQKVKRARIKEEAGCGAGGCCGGVCGGGGAAAAPAPAPAQSEKSSGCCGGGACGSAPVAKPSVAKSSGCCGGGACGSGGGDAVLNGKEETKKMSPPPSDVWSSPAKNRRFGFSVSDSAILGVTAGLMAGALVMLVLSRR